MKELASANLDKERREEIRQPLMPKKEWPRSSWGSLIGTLYSVRGLCEQRKCFRKQGHIGDHYPPERGQK